MTDYVLSKTYRATFDANGVALISNVGPALASEMWEIQYTAVNTSSSLQTVFRIYYDSALTRIRESTNRGNGNSSDTVMKLRASERLWYRWNGGTPGTEAQLTLTGVLTIIGDRGGGVASAV